MQKKAGLWLLALILSAALAGCMQSEKPHEGTATETAAGSPSELTGKPSGDAAPSEVGDETASDAGEDQKKIEVKLDAQLTVHENDLVIKGTTDLLPGAILRAEVTAKRYDMYGYKGEAVVGEDGSFELTVKKPKVKHTMDVKLYFSLSGQSDRHKEMYGPGGEKFDGPFVYQDSNFAEVWNYLGYHFYVDPASPVNTTVSYETPVWDRPADYGEPLVWLKPAVTKDDEFVYIKVKSNLLEGTSVTGDIELPGTTHYGYNDRTQVLPDGSFTLQFPHPKNSKEYDYRIEVIPENPPWPTVRDAYGPNGEKFAGELVKEKELTSRTVKFLELKVKITE